jgi:Cu+-exporting ATPase
MIKSTSATKDPVCGLPVDEASAPQVERDGETFYFCSSDCRQAFLSTPARKTAPSRTVNVNLLTFLMWER